MTERLGTAVVGLGNPLMGDDGLGLVALHELQEHWRFEPTVELVDGGTWGMTLLPLVESTDRILFLDAITLGAAPGTLIVLERDELPKFFGMKLSPHQVDLKEVLAVAELRGTLPPTVAAMGLQPHHVGMSTELSEVLRVGLPDLIDAVVERLGTWGHTATEHAAAPA